jgi:hypothetical protein
VSEKSQLGKSNFSCISLIHTHTHTMTHTHTHKILFKKIRMSSRKNQQVGYSDVSCTDVLEMREKRGGGCVCITCLVLIRVCVCVRSHTHTHGAERSETAFPDHFAQCDVGQVIRVGISSPVNGLDRFFSSYLFRDFKPFSYFRSEGCRTTREVC